MPKVKLPSGKVVKKSYSKKGVKDAKKLAKKTGGKIEMMHGKGSY